MHAAARLICEVEAIAQDYREQPSRDGELYDVPFATASVNCISGGDAGNVIPARCRLQIEARNMEHGQPAAISRRVLGHVSQEIVPYLRRTAPEGDVSVRELSSMPPLVRDAGNAAETLVARFSSSSRVEAVSYGTEAGFFQSIGLPTVVFGPGSMSQAHKVDEYITLDQFRKGELALSEIARTLF